MTPLGYESFEPKPEPAPCPRCGNPSTPDSDLCEQCQKDDARASEASSHHEKGSR